MSYHPKMTDVEKEHRVIEKLKSNTITSRQSGAQWTDVLNAHQPWIAARDGVKS